MLMRRCFFLALVLTALLCNAVRTIAAELIPPVLPSIDIPQASTAPSLTAPLDDPIWNTAATIGPLTLCVGPQAATVKPLPTTVQALWTPAALYVRFVCHGGDLYAPYGTTRDAPHHAGDVTEVFLDPVGDSREFVELQLNPVGGMSDTLHLLTAPAKSGPDNVLDGDMIDKDEWDLTEWNLAGLQGASYPILDGATSTGWVATFLIPANPTLKRLGARQFVTGMTFRANFLRYDQLPDGNGKRTGISMNWSPVVWGRPHRSPAAMGTVRLLAKP